MLPYFKRYTIYVCILAVALPVIYSTIYPILTGRMAASTFGGLITLILLLIIGLQLGYSFFEKRAQAEADALISIYNDSCNPEEFINKATPLADAMSAPYNQYSSWFISYFAQALLDVGKTNEAHSIYSNLVKSIDHAKKPVEKINICVNITPLAEKIEGSSEALKLIEKGLNMCETCKPSSVAQYYNYLKTQKDILQARDAKQVLTILQIDESIWKSNNYPIRIRVEYAWDAAHWAYKSNNKDVEKEALKFIAYNGGKLAMTKKAEQQLKTL